VDIERKNELFITMTLTREQLYQIYEDLQTAIKAGKGKREVTFEIIENIERFFKNDAKSKSGL
jgi:hypothetical protein